MSNRREELLALAERCEKATGTDRELDGWIWWTAGHLAALCPETENQPAAMAVGYYSGMPPSIKEVDLTMAHVTPAYKCPAYTASLDSAMSLVPEGFSGRVSFASPLSAYATVVDPLCTDELDDERMHSAEGQGPALALAAASLRALASQEITS